MQLYLKHLLISVEKKRNISIKEFCKTDLNAGESVEELHIWYDHITTGIQKSPPKYYVKYLEITEDENNQIGRVDYIYFNSDDKVYATEFMKKQSF